MNLGGLDGIEAVAFDIDGTLYESWKLNIRMPLYIIRYAKYFLAYNKVRKLLRANNETGDIRSIQAEYLAKELSVTAEKAETLLEELVYKGLVKKFKHISPCKGAVECVQKLKQAGYKIGILSDFPPEQKGTIWGLAEIADACLGTENCGALKPSPLPFIKLAEEMGTAPEKVLYVGNSYNYDIMGAKSCGMKSAWFAPKHKIKKTLADNRSAPDICFSTYEEFCQKLGIKN